MRGGLMSPRNVRTHVSMVAMIGNTINSFNICALIGTMLHMDLSLGTWREIAVLTMVLYRLGFVVAVVFHMRVADVVLVEGALIIGLGGYVAMGGSEGFDRSRL